MEYIKELPEHCRFSCTLVLHDINQIKVKKPLVFLCHILFFGQEFGIFF